MESLEVKTGNVLVRKVEKGKVSDEGVEGEGISVEGGESCNEGGEETVGEDGVGSATAKHGVGILGTKGGVSGNVRKEMSSVEKAEEDGRG